MKVYFGNESGEVVGTVLDQQFNQEAAGCYFYVPSFVVAMPDGTFKVVDIEKCKHRRECERNYEGNWKDNSDFEK